jgi:hypothetical protein
MSNNLKFTPTPFGRKLACSSTYKQLEHQGPTPDQKPYKSLITISSKYLTTIKYIKQHVDKHIYET